MSGKIRLHEHRGKQKGYRLGFDVLLEQDNTPHLLEYQIGPRGFSTREDSYLTHFLRGGRRKQHQHMLLPHFMLPYTDDRRAFQHFIRRHNGDVVYKIGNKDNGHGVAIKKKPEWMDLVDIVEKFVEPKCTTKKGKEYPFIIRYEVSLDISPKNVTWTPTRIVRKRSLHARGSTEDQDEMYRLNTSSSNATSEKPTKKEKRIVTDFSLEVLASICSQARDANWSMGRRLHMPSIQYYLGEENFYFMFSGCVDDLLVRQGILTTITSGDTQFSLEEAAPLYDLCIAKHDTSTSRPHTYISHSTSYVSYRSSTMRRQSPRKIIEVNGGEVIQTISAKPHVLVDNELTPEGFVQVALENHFPY